MCVYYLHTSDLMMPYSCYQFFLFGLILAHTLRKKNFIMAMRPSHDQEVTNVTPCVVRSHILLQENVLPLMVKSIVNIFCDKLRINSHVQRDGNEVL